MMTRYSISSVSLEIWKTSSSWQPSVQARGFRAGRFRFSNTVTQTITVKIAHLRLCSASHSRTGKVVSRLLDTVVTFHTSPLLLSSVHDLRSTYKLWQSRVFRKAPWSAPPSDQSLNTSQTAYEKVVLSGCCEKNDIILFLQLQEQMSVSLWSLCGPWLGKYPCCSSARSAERGPCQLCSWMKDSFKLRTQNDIKQIKWTCLFAMPDCQL